MDARLLSVQDVQNPKAYPYERGIGMAHSKMCMACNKLIAKWVTRNNDRVINYKGIFKETINFIIL